MNNTSLNKTLELILNIEKTVSKGMVQGKSLATDLLWRVNNGENIKDILKEVSFIFKKNTGVYFCKTYSYRVFECVKTLLENGEKLVNSPSIIVGGDDFNPYMTKSKVLQKYLKKEEEEPVENEEETISNVLTVEAIVNTIKNSFDKEQIAQIVKLLSE